MGNKVIITVEEKEKGANVSFEFVPPSSGEEESLRMYCVCKFLKILKNDITDELEE